jgi:hypothetical protein
MKKWNLSLEVGPHRVLDGWKIFEADGAQCPVAVVPEPGLNLDPEKITEVNCNPRQKANAHLIAAAPELREELTKTLALLYTLEGKNIEVLERIRSIEEVLILSQGR